MTKHHDGKRWNHRAGDWNRLYGFQRREKDRKILEECERQIALEEALADIPRQIEEIVAAAFEGRDK